MNLGLLLVCHDLRVIIMPPLLCAANAMYMAGQEMEKVLERDNGTIRRHLGKVRR